jgi:hypothetical protein
VTSTYRNIPCPHCSQETRLNCEMCAGTGRHFENQTLGASHLVSSFLFLSLALVCGSGLVWLVMRTLHRWAL